MLLVLLFACKKEEQEPQQKEECLTCTTIIITTTFHYPYASTAETTYVSANRCDSLYFYNGLQQNDTTFSNFDGRPLIAHSSITNCQ